MITIKMYKEKWQIHIGNERWQFEKITDFRKTLNQIIDIKDKYGKLKRE